jgi:ABC-type multidrug transport system fused ATPase/permease subunit
MRMNFFGNYLYSIKKINFLLEKKEKQKLIVLSIQLLIGTFFEMLSLGILIPIIGLLVKPALLNEYSLIKKLLNIIGNPNQKELIILGMLIIVFIYLIKSVYLIFLTWSQSNFSNKISTNLSKRLFQGYLFSPYIFHLNTNSSILLRNIQNDISSFTSVAQNTIIILLELSVLIGIVSILILTEPIGALSIISYLFVAAIFFQKITKNKLLSLGKEKQNISPYVNKYLLQGLGGIKDIKIFRKENHFLNKFNIHNNIYAKINTKIYTMTMIPRLYLELLSISGLAALVITIVLQNKPIEMVITTMGVFAAASYRMIPSVNRILSSSQIIRSSIPAIDNLYLEFKKIEFNSKKYINSEDINFSFKNQIEISNLSFSYSNNKDRFIFKNINLLIKKGEMLGIVGTSGSGKSTFIDNIMGLLDPTFGEILIDDINIQLNLNLWKSFIGYVPQNIYLIDDTIEANIAFGLSSNEISQSQLNACIKSAQLSDYITNLENGLSTIVGERGARISGGQRQRIGIARALYHNPQILILDEATSSLDNDTEKKIMEDIIKLKGKKTLIIIAHRTSTLESCDRIIKFDDSLFKENP